MSQRRVVLDTETTGLSPQAGHRIIEIGCVEIEDRSRTGRTFHTYINPKREVEAGAFRVHGISNEFLNDKPLFQNIADELMEFIAGAELIIHNAPFDTGFLNAEFALLQRPSLEGSCTVFDTLAFARSKHPGQRNTLDALCKRYDINHFNREFHGALLDAEILTAVYLAMTGGQASLFDEEKNELETLSKEAVSNIAKTHEEIQKIPTFVQPASAEELEKHKEFIQFLKGKAKEVLWE
jgi:DNA polymerase-3 subunit epsilon